MKKEELRDKIKDSVLNPVWKSVYYSDVVNSDIRKGMIFESVESNVYISICNIVSIPVRNRIAHKLSNYNL